MKASIIASTPLLMVVASTSAADWQAATVTSVARTSGIAGPPANASCCIEYTFESSAQKVVAVKFWYYKAPEPTLKVGNHIKFRRRRGWGGGNCQVTDDGGKTQALYLTMIEYIEIGI